MLSIGEFSKICQVSTKTLRYYADIGLILPGEINPETGYRYYAIEQLDTMLLIHRLKSYQFSLEEIGCMITSGEDLNDVLCHALSRKKCEIQNQVKELEYNLSQLESDLLDLKQGKSILTYLEDIDVSLTEVPPMNLLSIRKMVQKDAFPNAYICCFDALSRKIEKENLSITAPPMVLFHDEEFSPTGLDTEFAIPVQQYVTGTRNFHAGLCLKTVVKGSYTALPSVYTKQIKWTKQEGYECTDALFEVYESIGSKDDHEDTTITTVYLPVKKKK